MIGGSNYPFWSVGIHATEDKPWADDGNLKPVVGTYHLAPDKVRQQLKTMYANGQRRITLPIWFKRIPETGTFFPNVDRHMIDCSQSELRPQHRLNLLNVLADIIAAGFQGVTIRFFHQGQSHPGEWKEWDEARFAENRDFIFNTQISVELALQRVPFEPLYDLSGELGGSTRGQAALYQMRLWKHLPRRSYACSFATGDRPSLIGQRLMRFIDQCDENNLPRPELYAVDIYDSGYDNLLAVLLALQAKEEHRKPVIIQETWYNDAESKADIERAGLMGLNVRSIIQWPRRRGSPRYQFEEYPAEYGEYLK